MPEEPFQEQGAPPIVDDKGRVLPKIKTIGELVKYPPKKRPEVIRGILRQSSKMGLAGASKARKTWQLINLAISVATGQDWLKFETVPNKVLYINLELHEDTFFDRLGYVCEALETSINDVSENLSSWCLRGFATGYDKLVPIVVQQIKTVGLGLVIFDPTYKILGDLDENKAGDITKLMNELEEVCHETGAALVMAYHYSKGNKANAQDGDRTRGSGVFFADPDALMEFVPQADSDESNDILVVKSILREFRPVSPFTIEWDGSAIFNVSNHDPNKLKKAGGRPSNHNEMDLLAVLGIRRMTSTEWQKECQTEKGISKPTFFRLKKNLDNGNLVSKVQNPETKDWQ